jgi:hypothetical protein
MPLLVDLLILGSSLQYVAAARLGHPILGWRLTTHAGVTATLILNPLAARRLSEVPGYLTGPTVWAILVELTPQTGPGPMESHPMPHAETASSSHCGPAHPWKPPGPNC